MGLVSFRSSRWFLLLLVSLLIAGAAGGYALHRRTQVNQEVAVNARSPWQQALQALDKQELRLARTKLEEWLDVWPIYAEAHFLLAQTCRRLGDDAGWQVHMKRAKLLGWEEHALTLEHELMQAQSGNLHAVEDKLLRQLDSLPPEEELILEALAEGYLKTERLQALLELTRQWSVRFPEHWRPRLYHARGLLLAHSVDQAIAEYGRVLALNADHALAHLELAGALLADSRFGEAAEHYRTYLLHYPEDAAALARLANCQLALGQTDAARASLNRLFAAHKDDAPGFFVRAKLELAEGRPEEALHWLQRAEALAPYETDITYNLLLVLQRLGKQAEAKRYEEKLQTLRQQYADLEALKAKIRSLPDNADLRAEAGAIALRLGHYEEAGRWLRSALQIDPNHRLAHKLLAEFSGGSQNRPVPRTAAKPLTNRLAK